MAAHTRGGRRTHPGGPGPRMAGNTMPPPGRSNDPNAPEFWWGVRLPAAVAFEHSPCNVALHRVHRLVRAARAAVEAFLEDEDLMAAFEAWYGPADAAFIARYLSCGAFNMEEVEVKLDSDLMGRPAGSRVR